MTSLSRTMQTDRQLANRKLANTVASFFIALGTLVVLLPLFAVFWYLISQGISSLNLDFFIKMPVPVGELGGGLANAIVGTIILIAIASVIGVFFGIGTGIFLAEYAEHPLVPTIRLVSDVLSGIPAIVMGLVVYSLVVMVIKPPFSALAGGLALGLLMIPIVVRTTEEVLKLVPRTVREAGLSLGLPKWRVTLSIVLPAAAGGIITGVMLSVARVAGEAAPLLFTAFGNQFWNIDPTKPIAALPLVIYNYSISPYEEWHRLATAAALVLVIMVFFATLIARIATRRK